MQPESKKFELVCPAGSLPALKTAVDNGADCVYMGFRDDTNARNFTGLNFDLNNAREGVRYAHAKGRKVLLALNTYPQTSGWQRWTSAIDNAAELGMAAVIANEFAEATSSMHIHALTAIGLVLFGVTLIVNGLARLLIYRVIGRPGGGR